MKQITIVNLVKTRTCYNCGSNKTLLRQSRYERWYNIEDGVLCHKCYQKLKGYPRYKNPNSKKFNNKHNPNKLWFKTRSILLDWNPRIDICSKCGKYDEKTHMHHALGYYMIFPWYGTIELCNVCHMIEEHNIK